MHTPFWSKLGGADLVEYLCFLAATGLERTTGQTEARFVSSENDCCMFEATFKKVPASFGPVGAVRIDNDHEQEMFITDVKVIRDGDESSAVCFHCESWVIDNEKNVADDSRVFFPLKVSI